MLRKTVAVFTQQACQQPLLCSKGVELQPALCLVPQYYARRALPGHCIAERSTYWTLLCGYCTHRSPSLLHGLALNAQRLAAYPGPGLQVSSGCVPACSLQRLLTF